MLLLYVTTFLLVMLFALFKYVRMYIFRLSEARPSQTRVQATKADRVQLELGAPETGENRT